MANCPYCTTVIEEAYNFCINCENQVKCTKCSSVIVKGKSKCLVCGTAIVVTEQSLTPVNTLKIKEVQTKNSYSYELDVSLTNEGMANAPSIFGSGNIPIRHKVDRTLHIRPNSEDQQLPGLPLSSNDSNNLESNQDEDENKQQTALLPEGRGDSGSKSFFNVDSKGYLILKNPDLKSNSKKEQIARFFILYVWAYNDINNAAVPSKDHILYATKLNSLYDKNFSTYFTAVAKVHFAQTDGTFMLNGNGTKLLNTIKGQINDENIQTTFDPSNTSSKSRAKRTVIDEATQNKIKEWISKQTKFSSFDIRKADTNPKICIIPFYDVIHEIKGTESLSASVAYEYLLKKFKSIPITKAAFSKVVTAKDYSKYFYKTPDSKYYLTSEGDKIAEVMLNNQ